MRTSKRGVLIVVVVLLLFPLVAVQAAKGVPPRQEKQTKTETQYLWWLLPWGNPREVQCQIGIYHPDKPTPEEIYSACGWDLYQAWVNTPPCAAAAEGKATTACKGYYLMFVGAREVTHTVTISYPPPTVELHLSQACQPSLPHYRCPQPVQIVLHGVEFFPKAYINGIHAKASPEADVACDLTDCVVTLPAAEDVPTTYHLTFWASSSWGDRTPEYSASVRITPLEDDPNVVVDVLSTQWRDEGVDACAQAWQTFPPVPAPSWAKTPSDPQALSTDVPYALLAKQLIQHGIVDASDCPQGGITADGATPCGMARARDAVAHWQNLFDEPLRQAALETGIPAVLFKRLIAHESQFWPGDYANTIEVGFGQLSPQGMDTLFLWDRQYFNTMCSQVLFPWVCRKGYLRLTPQEKQLLYGSLWVQANLTCSNCPYGVDLDRAEESLSMFAHLIKAHCYQTGQTVTNLTRRPPGEVTSYEDMWRFTLANYNGPNCIYAALWETNHREEPLDWLHVSQHFTDGCQDVRGYVETLLPPSDTLAPPASQIQK